MPHRKTQHQKDNHLPKPSTMDAIENKVEGDAMKDMSGGGGGEEAAIRW
jgi:hypothetical protein